MGCVPPTYLYAATLMEWREMFGNEPPPGRFDQFINIVANNKETIGNWFQNSQKITVKFNGNSARFILRGFEKFIKDYQEIDQPKSTKYSFEIHRKCTRNWTKIDLNLNPNRREIGPNNWNFKSSPEVKLSFKFIEDYQEIDQPKSAKYSFEINRKSTRNWPKIDPNLNPHRRDK